MDEKGSCSPVWGGFTAPARAYSYNFFVPPVPFHGMMVNYYVVMYPAPVRMPRPEKVETSPLFGFLLGF